MMNVPKNLFRFAASALLLLLVAGCGLEITNPQAVTQDDVLETPEGIRGLAVSIQDLYATSAFSSSVLTPGVTGRELAINTTFANLIDLEAGGARVTNTNGNVNGLWESNYRVIGAADDLIENAPNVQLAEGTRSGILALARLHKAMALGNLAQNFEQAAITTPLIDDAAFVPRQEVFAETVRLLGAALDEIDATPPSEAFNSSILAGGLDLRNTILAYRARYNLFAGNYEAALRDADAVDPAVTSTFVYDEQGDANPIRAAVGRDASYAPRDAFGTMLTDTSDARLDFYLIAVDTLSTPNGLPIDGLAGFFTALTDPIPAYLPDEMPLIRAEANVRQGNLEAAVDEIDAVRTQEPADDPFGVGAALGAYDGPVTEAALLEEIFYQRRAELFLQGFGLEDRRRLLGEEAAPGDPFARTRTFYPYPQQERLNNPNTPADPAI